MKFALLQVALTALATASTIHVRHGEVGSATARSTAEPRMTFNGHHIFRIANAPRNLEHEFPHYHAARAGLDVDVVIPAEEVHEFLERRDLDVTLLHSDLGELLKRESAPGPYDRKLHKRGELPDDSWFDSYHAYEEHLQHWRDLQAAFPDNSVIFELGKSYEGRTMYAFRMWGGEKKCNPEKPVVLWHGTVHAREWITTMVVEYLTTKLIAGYKAGEANATAFLDAYDFYIVPFHNPDGFVYTQTTNRLWRKNRQPRLNTTCVGTDGNRNWDFQWDHPLDGGSVSSNPCGETFRGLSPGDTFENKVLAPLSRKLAASPKGIRLFIDWHSYSQLILLPWGFSCEPAELPANLPRQREVGANYAKAIAETSGMNYTVGPSCEVLYYSTGSARDFHYGSLNATFSWSVELRPMTAGQGGFVLPPEQIRGTAEEHWVGIQQVLHDVLEG